MDPLHLKVSTIMPGIALGCAPYRSRHPVFSNHNLISAPDFHIFLKSMLLTMQSDYVGYG
jgi:hypothetical protein